MPTELERKMFRELASSPCAVTGQEYLIDDVDDIIAEGVGLLSQISSAVAKPNSTLNRQAQRLTELRNGVKINLYP